MRIVEAQAIQSAGAKLAREVLNGNVFTSLWPELANRLVDFEHIEVCSNEFVEPDTQVPEPA